MNSNDFWLDKEKANKTIEEINSYKEVIEPFDEIENSLKKNIELLNEVIDEKEEIYKIIEEEYYDVKNKIEDLEIKTYLNKEYDKLNCILEIHSGAGGTESCDWVNMLYRMYTRYLKKKNYKITELESLKGEETGYKSVMIKVEGNYAYGYLKNEKGIHRLVRISPFDSNKRRHTSFASIEVTPQIDKNIEININDNDLKIDIFRSSGPGGQGVNTTDSAVRITHIPTGIVVTCQNERSQIQNKEHCMEVLKSKLYKIELDKKEEEINKNKQNKTQNGFGSGKRSYVLCPYTRVVDNESGYETSQAFDVLDGEIEEFIKNGLRK